MWKNVWKEIVYFFWPLKYRHKRIFIYLFVTIPTTLYIGVYLLFHCTEIRWEYEIDQNFWINFSGLLLGYALTVVVGFCIYLKKSTNNIVELLIGIDKILAQVENSNTVFIILPSPFLGYFYYKKYYESFKNFYDKNTTYYVAYLENNKEKMKELKKELEDKYNQNKETIKSSYKSSLLNPLVRKINNKEMEIRSKRMAWQEVVDQKEKYTEGNSHLLKFHVDELIHAEKKNDEDRYDYMIELCSFVNKIEKKGRNNYIHIPYNYKSTVFPIIIMNQERKDLLHGTVEVESQSFVKFTGESLKNADLCNEAEKIYKAYCKSCK